MNYSMQKRMKLHYRPRYQSFLNNADNRLQHLAPGFPRRS